MRGVSSHLLLHFISVQAPLWAKHIRYIVAYYKRRRSVWQGQLRSAASKPQGLHRVREKDAALLLSLKVTSRRWKQCFLSRHFIWHMLAWVVSNSPFIKAGIYQKSFTNSTRVTCFWLTNPVSHPQATEISLASSPLFEHLPKPLTIKTRFYLINWDEFLIGWNMKP